MADSLQDLGTRLIAIAQALASATDHNADQLRSLMPAQVGDPLAATRAAIESAANGVLQRANDEVARVTAIKEAAERQADAQVQQAKARIEEQRDRAIAEADRAKAAAEAGLEQARAMGDQALAAAQETRDAAVQKAEQAKTDAESAFTSATAKAQELAGQAKDAAAEAVAEAEQAVAAARDQLDPDVLARAARTAVDDALAAVAGLPDEAMALGKDTLERLEGALTWPSGILSLVAKALIWLKKECFSDLEALQVIWHEPAGDHAGEPAGLGLQWLQGDTRLRLVYRPPVPPTVGAGTLLIETKGADIITFAASGVDVTFHGHADQHVVVGKGAPAPAVGAGDAELVVSFDPKFNRQFGPLIATVDKPTLTVKLNHATAWSYDVKLELPKYGATLSLSELLEQAGLPIPITVPSIDEHRSLSLGVADGKFSVREGASA